MAIEGLHNYLSTRLPLELDVPQRLRMLLRVFLLVFASSFVIHLLIQQDKTLSGMLIHATTVGLVYVAGVGIATILLHGIRDESKAIRVWHLWLGSLIGFLLGYYFLPVDEWIVWLLGVNTSDHASTPGFLELLPVWFIASYLFVQPYLNQGLRMELSRLRSINALLKSRDRQVEPKGQQSIHFESGRTNFTLHADSIRNIAVEDHYCYVHYQHNDEFTKRDVAMPLRDVQTLLPGGFVQVHRSHIVNLKHMLSINRKNRSIRVTLNGGYEVPVSRHRLEEVLPVLRQQIEMNIQPHEHQFRVTQ